MATFSINSNIPGVKLNLREQPASVVQSSEVLPMIVVAVDVDNMQSTFLDGAHPGQANTDTMKVIFETPSAVKDDQFVGEYIYDSNLDEARQIVGNSAAASGSNVTVDVSKPFSSAVSTSGLLNIRRWEDTYIPKLYTSPQKFYSDYIPTGSDGDFSFSTLSQNVRYSLQSLFANGASRAIVLPVSGAAVAATMATNLGDTDNTKFVNSFRLLANAPDVIVVPKQDNVFPAAPSTSDWATVDSNWTTFVGNQAAVDTASSRLLQMSYITGTPTTDQSVAVTYRTSDWNSTSERAVLVHGKYLAQGITDGTRVVVCPSPAVAGIVNRVSTTSPQSTGHSFSGVRLSQIVDALDVVEDISDAETLTLTVNGINPVVQRPGRGTYLMQQLTQAKSSSSSATKPGENFNTVVSRNRIFNALQPVLFESIDEPNTSATRAVILAQINNYLDSLIGTVILSYQSQDTTSAADIAAKTAEFEVLIAFPNEIKFISLNLSAQLG